MEKVITSEQAMIDYGTEIAKDLTGGDIVLLHGDLGAGKTTITKGIAKGLGIEDEMVSPTFTLMNVYADGKLVHIDTYRLEDEEQLIEIGVEDYLARPETITIIEWPEKIDGLLKGKKVVNVMIEHVDEGRKINITPWQK